MSVFDEEPDGDPHGECRIEIESLRAQLVAKDAEIERLNEYMSALTDDKVSQTDELVKANAEIARLRAAFDTRQWTRKMSDAWHLAIPDLNTAFKDLLAATLEMVSER